jgi:hypothetical protein
MEMVQQEDTNVNERIDHEEYTLLQQLKQMENAVENHDAMMEENKVLKRRKREEQEARSKESTNHALKVHALKKDMVELRQQLEQTFRKALMETDRTKQQYAFEALHDSSKSALLANAKLKEELALQTLGRSNLDLRREKQATELGGIRGEINGLVDAATRHQSQIAVLKRQMHAYELRMIDMEQNVKRLEYEKAAREETAVILPSMEELHNDVGCDDCPWQLLAVPPLLLLLFYGRFPSIFFGRIVAIFSLSRA